MQRRIHVNSYTRKDGTFVKEHERNIETGTFVLLPEENGPVIDEQDQNPLEKLFPNIFSSTMNMEAAPVLQGGISVDVGFPAGGIGEVLGSIGGVLGTVIGVGVELAPIALEIYKAMNSGNEQAVKYLKPQFNTKIKQLDTQVAQMKTNIDNNVTKLVNAKNQVEYSKIYEPLQKDWQAYQHASNIVNRIKAYANNGDFQSVANELGNFTKNNPQKIISNLLQPNTLNSMTTNEKILNTASKPVSPFLKVSGSNLQNAMQNFKYAKDNPHAHILNSRTKITNQGLSQLMGQVGIPENSRGVIYDNNSEQSKLLWQSPEIQGFIKTNLKDLISGNAKDVYDIEFKASWNYTGHRLDNYLGLQHCKLYMPQITQDGHFKGIIVDYYDFVYRDLIGTPKEIVQNYINNWGYSMQEKGYLENIFNIYVIFERLW